MEKWKAKYASHFPTPSTATRYLQKSMTYTNNSTGTTVRALQLEVNTGYFAKDRTNGPVFRLFLDIRTMSQGASTQYSCAGCRTALPAERRRLTASASRTCISALGNRK